MCKHTVKKSLLIRYVLGQCKTQLMRGKTNSEYVAILKSVPDCYKNQETCNKAVDNYPDAL